MCLTRTSEPRSHKRALLISTASFCLIAASGQVSALQDAQLIQIADDDDEVVVETNAETTATTTAATTTATAAAAALQSDVDTFPASFFDQYTPQNAMDMIDRLPGFSFDEGSNARGFGGTAGNVLIDGSRPTSKSLELDDALERIPAAQVERIEIIRGGVSGGEAAGQSVVANVIRKATGTSGTWNLRARRRPTTGDILPTLEATLTTKLGGWDTSFDIDIGANPRHRVATIEHRDADGTLTQSEYELRPDMPKWLWASGEASRSFAGGKLTINGRTGGFNWDSDITQEGYFNRLPDGGALDTLWTLDQGEHFRESELGIDWTKTNAKSWKWRLIGLGRIERSEYSDTSTDEDFTTGESSTSVYSNDWTKTEYILRSTYGDAGTGKFKPEFGVEVANNRLDTEADSVDDGVFDDLDGSDVVVDEIRGEGFVTFNYQASKKLTFDGGLTFEASRIKVTGDSENSQKLSFWKPRLSATYSFNDDIQLNIEAEREVGQLNFNRFASGNNSQDGRSTGGNSGLQPDKKDRIAATLDWSYSDRGSIKAKVYHQWRKDILEEIILEDDSFGTGNAGNATFYGWEVEGNIPLDSVLKGGLLEVKYRERYSSFKDPILGGDSRKISFYTPSWLSFEFRQDITSAKFAWGLMYFGSFHDDAFMVDEIQRFQGNKRIRVFAETTRYFGVKMRLEVNHANTGKYTRSRFFYDGDRGGAFTGSEVSYRKRKPEFRFDISGTF
jgi:hypothetical protein